MKKYIFILSILSLSVISCKPKKEGNTNTEQSTTTGTYSIDEENSVVAWTGYKFTNKKGVKGIFTVLDLVESKKGSSIKEAIEGAEIAIPVSSISSNNQDRDYKLVNIFFAAMRDTQVLHGKVLAVKENYVDIELTLNSEKHIVPFHFEKRNGKAFLNANIELNDWHALDAVRAIHKACELLHTGADGASKTWSEVAVEITLAFNKE